MKKKHSAVKGLITQFGGLILSWKNHEEEICKLLSHLESLNSSIESIKRISTKMGSTTALTNKSIMISYITEISPKLNDFISCTGHYCVESDRYEFGDSLSSYDPHIGPRMVAKMLVDCEAMYVQVKQFM